jgi:hypothetical protein
MQLRTGVAIAGAATVAAVALALALAGGSSAPAAPKPAATHTHPAPPRPSATTRFGGAREDCSTRSEANFPGAFTDARNLVVGPLVMTGGAYTDAETVRKFGGNKFALLVKAGHVVTVRLADRAPSFAGLAYGPLPQGETRLSDTHRSVTFVACRPGKASRHSSPTDGPSGSSADGTAVTFWAGFVLTRKPVCLPLEIYVDDERSPRHAGLGLGRRCSA